MRGCVWCVAVMCRRQAAPETADDFERLLLGSPNSSYLWIKYMAYQLSLADIDAARCVARAAGLLQQPFGPR